MSSNSRDGSTRVRFWPRRAGSNAMTNLLWPGLLFHRLVARRRPHILNPASPGRSFTLLTPCAEIFTRLAGVRATIRGRVVRSELETEEDSEPREPYRATCAGAHDDRDPCDLRGRLPRRPLMTDPSLQRPGETDRGGGGPPGGAIRGRELELRAVLELVRGAAKGHGGALLIEGEVGAGKSLLLSHAVLAAQAEGVSVAAAAADELSRFMPLAPPLMALGESSAGLAGDARRGQVALQGLQTGVF